eukprot:Tamp_13717.p1 GENE.Tamp_13717~~Tamp_13717.p1  ORF type:complete len:529 (-),score=121.49 Tamp_13717:105-1640(-)
MAEDLAFYEAITVVDDEALRGATLRALDTLGSALRLYGPERTVVSFNGGKDADVVLHLMRAASAKYCADNGLGERPPLVYFEDPKEFPEVEAHVASAVDRYGFRMLRYSSGLKAGLADLVDQSPRTLAFVLGTRQGDPNCGDQGAFAPSSSYMPNFMRVNPIITWSYGLVWQFINLHKIPVCSLYQDGYTSLGKVDNTERNPALRGADGSYLPAYCLKDWSLERMGRGGQAKSGGEGEARDPLGRIRGAQSVGIVIVGDEVLLGKVMEENSKYAIEEFRKRGLPVHRIAVVRDNATEIAEEIRRQSAMCDMVLSSGGIGPTHDDVTMHAIASAFHTQVQENAEMLALLPGVCRVSDTDALSPSQRRLAMLPRGGDLVWGTGEHKSDWPLFLFDNVFVLPGVPQFFRAKLDTILNSFIPARKVFTARARIAAPETSLVSSIDHVVKGFPAVKIGSYPVNGMEETVVTFEWLQDSEDGSVQEVSQAALALERKIQEQNPMTKVTIDDSDSILQ